MEMRKCFSLFILFFVCFLDLTTSSLPIVIAHRGASGLRPEHTLASYEYAINIGADYIEADVGSTKDHQLVALHDNNLIFATDIQDHPEFASKKTIKLINKVEAEGWFVEDFTLEELRTLRVVQRFPFRSQQYNNLYQIPTLKEVLQFILAKEQERSTSIGFYVEVKEPTYYRSIGLPLEEKLLSIFSSFNFTERNNTFIESFDESALRILNSSCSIPLVYLSESNLSDEQLKEIATYSDGVGLSKYLIIPPVESTDFGLVDPTKIIERSHNMSLFVHVWTFRDDVSYINRSGFGSPFEEYFQYFRLGVDGVFSDFPETALQARTDYRLRTDAFPGDLVLYGFLVPVITITTTVFGFIYLAQIRKKTS